MQCCLLTACLFLCGKPFSNTHTDLLSSSMPSCTLPLRRTKGDMSIPQRQGGSLGIEPSPAAPWSGGVETWQEWPAAGWSPVGWVFPACPGGIPSSVRYDLPLCFVAEHWQMRYCHSPALGHPLWRGGKRKGFTCLSSLGRWEATAHGVPKGKGKESI